MKNLSFKNKSRVEGHQQKANAMNNSRWIGSLTHRIYNLEKLLIENHQIFKKYMFYVDKHSIVLYAFMCFSLLSKNVFMSHIEHKNQFMKNVHFLCLAIN